MDQILKIHETVLKPSAFFQLPDFYIDLFSYLFFNEPLYLFFMLRSPHRSSAYFVWKYDEQAAALSRA